MRLVYDWTGYYLCKDIENTSITLSVDSNDSIANIKQKIQDKKSIPPEQRLIFAGKQLEDNRCWSDDIIQRNQHLFAVCFFCNCLAVDLEFYFLMKEKI